jgi:uncharacterized protein (TIGR03086 family)
LSVQQAMDPTAFFEAAGEYFIGRLEQVPDDAWQNATPCAGWTVRVVAAHNVNGFQMIGALLAHQPLDPNARNRDTLGTDPVGVSRKALKAALDAWRKPGALDTIVDPPPGRMPARAFALVRAADVVIHTWDMTTGAGIDNTIPGDLVQAVLEFSSPAILAGGRAKGVFGPEVKVDSDADAQSRLLALYGRRAEQVN